MEPLSSDDVFRALQLIAESDACKENTMLGSILLIASSHIKELVLAKKEAESLAQSIYRLHYMSDKEYRSGKLELELCESVPGVISQIDNMLSGLTLCKKNIKRDDFEDWYSKAYGTPVSVIKNLRKFNEYNEENIRLNIAYDTFLFWAKR